MRRASVSISSNIEEGATRKGDKELIQFIMIALALLSELEIQYLIAVKLKFIVNDEKVEKLLLEVKKLLLGFEIILKTNKIELSEFIYLSLITLHYGEKRHYLKSRKHF